MQCNQRFFGQEHFEPGTPGRNFCSSLGVLRPRMDQYGFSVRDEVPQIMVDTSGLAQVKYNGMLSIAIWDDQRGGFVAWSPRGRCYYSLPGGRKHPVTEYLNQRFSDQRNLAFVGETYVTRKVGVKAYMTEFNKSMSIIKNPGSPRDVARIRLAVFNYMRVKSGGGFENPDASYIDRFEQLQRDFKIPVGCDSSVVHLPDSLEIEKSFKDSHAEIQGFWDEYIRERGFEGIVIHTANGEEYKVKYRDTLDAAIIAFRMTGDTRPSCDRCGAKLDTFWLRKLARDGAVKRSDWFSPSGHLLAGQGPGGIWGKSPAACPVCGGQLSNTAGPILGAKIALMTPEGDFVDVADGAQISPLSPMLEVLEPLYEEGGYLWVKPQLVIEVSYQQLYVDSPRPVYHFENGRYRRVGTRNGVSLRPYRARHREDKTVNPNDLRLEQVSYFVGKIKGIRDEHSGQLPLDLAFQP